MKIFIVYNSTQYIFKHANHLIKKLLARGHDIYGLAPRDNYASALPRIGVKHIDIHFKRSGTNPMADLWLLFRYFRIYKKYRPDLVHHFTIKPVIYGTLAARLAKIKYIFNMIPGLGYVFIGKGVRKSLVRLIVRSLYRIALRSSRHTFFQNHDDQKYFLDFGIIRDHKSSVLPGIGVDTNIFAPQIKNEDEKNVNFIFVGRILWDKGIGEFVEAARCLKKRYPNAQFNILGPIDLANPSGVTPDRLNKWIESGMVNYLGVVDNVIEYLGKSHVIVLPSYREGNPVSLLEGAAMGMPIIATDAVGCREVVKDGVNGYLVPIKDSDALAKAMEKFLRQPELIKKMGSASRKMAIEKFDVDIVVNEILSYYPN